MRLLLDTHTLIWWHHEPQKLSTKALALCQDSANELWFSVAGVWEIQIKVQLRKLSLGLPLAQLIQKQQENGLQLLSITPPHIYALDSLPMHHRDPFDRLIIAQAQTENLTIVGNDSQFVAYGVQMIW